MAPTDAEYDSGSDPNLAPFRVHSDKYDDAHSDQKRGELWENPSQCRCPAPCYCDIQIAELDILVADQDIRVATTIFELQTETSRLQTETAELRTELEQGRDKEKNYVSDEEKVRGRMKALEQQVAQLEERNMEDRERIGVLEQQVAGQQRPRHSITTDFGNLQETVQKGAEAQNDAAAGLSGRLDDLEHALVKYHSHMKQPPPAQAMEQNVIQRDESPPASPEASRPRNEGTKNDSDSNASMKELATSHARILHEQLENQKDRSDLFQARRSFCMPTM